MTSAVYRDNAIYFSYVTLINQHVCTVRHRSLIIRVVFVVIVKVFVAFAIIPSFVRREINIKVLSNITIITLTVAATVVVFYCYSQNKRKIAIWQYVMFLYDVR